MVSKRLKDNLKGIIVIAAITWAYFNFAVVGIAGLQGNAQALLSFLLAIVTYSIFGDKIMDLIT